MKQSSAPSQQPTQISFWASYVLMAILVLVPFSALLATWAGSNFGHLDAFRIWKEFLLVPLGVYAAVLVAKHKALRDYWVHSWLVWLTLLYGVWFVGYGAHVWLNHSVVHAAILDSLITNLRFLWFMLVVWAVCYTNDLIRRYWVQLVLIPAGAVVVFGVLQRLLLSADFLRHFGYGPKTIPAIETVDQKLQYRRVQSTLRGANPLGAYLILPILTAGAYVRRRSYLWIFLGLALVCLFFTYSRSAELGLLVALAFYGWHNLTNKKLRQQLFAAGVAGLLLLAGLTFALRHNTMVQNTLFHTDQNSHSSVSSNAQRSAALKQGLHDVVHQPLGQGPGTAGPASVRNNGHTRLAENYYLQIGQEVGVVGLLLFTLITLLTGWQLWQRSDRLSRVLLATLVGVTVVNMLSHAWADDTLALLWWGLAGAALSTPAILNRKHHEQKAKTNPNKKTT